MTNKNNQEVVAIEPEVRDDFTQMTNEGEAAIEPSAPKEEGSGNTEKVAEKEVVAPENKKGPSVEFAFSKYIVAKKVYGMKKGLLYRWSWNHWKRIEDAVLDKEACKFLRDSVRISAVRSCVGVAKLDLPDIPDTPDNRIIIPCRNWYMEIVSGKVKWLKPDPKLGFMSFIDTNHSDATPCRFTEYLDMCVPDKEIQMVLQEYAGYTLLGDCRFERAMLLYGKGANGKSVFIEIIRALHANAKAIRLDQMKDFELGGIIGASLLTSDETPKSKVCGETLKALISGNAISIRELYGKPFDIKNTAKILISANEYPHFDDASDGFWRRWTFVPFKQTVPVEKRDPLLAKTIINEELGGVLAWAVKGLLRILKTNGQFTAPAALEKEKKAVRQEANSVLGWMAERVISENTEGYPTAKPDVYREYAHWALDNALTPVKGNAFWKRLKNELSFDLDDRQKRVNGISRRYVNFNIGTRWDEAANDDVLPFHQRLAA